jgi:replication initiation protein RepC
MSMSLVLRVGTASKAVKLSQGRCVLFRRLVQPRGRGMRTETAPPTGRRKITPAMIVARATRPTTWQPVRRGEALSALKRAAPALGIPRQVVTLMDYLVGRTRDADWAEGGRPMAWPSNVTLQDVLDVGRTQVKTLIRVALEHGLLEMDESPNGQRYGYREEGQITEAYGFDLTPLAARASELEQIARAHQERRREGARMRARITSLRNKVLVIADAGSWPALSAEAYALAGLRGDTRDPCQLAPVLARLESLLVMAEERLATCILPVETDPMGTTDRPPITPTNQPKIAKANTVVAGQTPMAHEKSRSRDCASNSNTPPGEAKKQGAREGTASALRGFVVTPEFILQIAPQFRDWVPSGRPKWGELEEAATFVRSDLGISLHAWGQACVVLGRMEAVTALAAIAARQAVGKVRSAGGLLRRMVDLHAAGELRLDRTLFGLADQHRPVRLKADLHSARGLRQ